jgi:hypothetical protein
MQTTQATCDNQTRQENGQNLDLSAVSARQRAVQSRRSKSEDLSTLWLAKAMEQELCAALRKSTIP